MLKDRAELENHLIHAIDRVKYNRRKTELINRSLAVNGVPRGYFNEIINNTELLNDLDYTMLYLVTDAVHTVDGAPSIKPDVYFTEIEIETAKKFKGEGLIEPEVKLPITLYDVIQIDPEVYVTRVKMTDVVKWMNSQILIYDFETQRSPVFKKNVGGGAIPLIDINPNSVKSISERMLNETYFPDMLTIRCYSEEYDPIIYNPKTRQLTIRDGILVSALDGMHRIQGGIRAATENPDLPQVMILGIRTYDTETSKKFFAQINMINLVDPNRIKDLDQEQVSFIAVKYLQTHSELKGRLSTGSKVARSAGHLTTTSILASAIEEVFEPKSNLESREAGMFLADFFDFLIGSYPEEFSNESESLMRHERAFIAHVAIAKQFKDKDIKLSKVKSVYEGLDFSNDNEKIVEILGSRMLSGRQIKNIVDFFENINIEHILEAEV